MLSCRLFFPLILPLLALGTSVPQVSLEDAVTRSELIVTGDVVRSWSAWDAGHQFIWTHSEIAIREHWKGAPGATVTVSEPGGEVDGVGQAISGAVRYAPGEQVVLFLYRTPNGLLRTFGWGQGKLKVDPQQRVHLTHSAAATVKGTAGAAAAPGTPMNAVESENLAALRARVLRTAKAVQK